MIHVLTLATLLLTAVWVLLSVRGLRDGRHHDHLIPPAPRAPIG